MERYETPEMEVILFETEDVITTSSLATNELNILWEELMGTGSSS